MKRFGMRAVLHLTLGLLVATVAAGCTLSGATEAPPADTPLPTVAQAAITQAPIATLRPTASPTTLLVLGSPTPSQGIDPFATLTAQAQLTPGSGTFNTAIPSAFGTPITPTVAGIGVVTPTKAALTSTPIPAAVASNTGSCPATYTVQAGDNLYRIALKFNLTAAQLAAANGIANPDLIIVGTVLKIPGCGGNAPAPASTAAAKATSTIMPGTVKPQTGDTVATNGDILHTVKSGENLYRIALAYGLSWQLVATYNGITSPDQLVVGQVLHIPTK